VLSGYRGTVEEGDPDERETQVQVEVGVIVVLVEVVDDR
jgi:hypothetical protein